MKRVPRLRRTARPRPGRAPPGRLRRSRRQRRRDAGGRVVLPAGVRRRSGSPGSTSTSTSLTAPGVEPHDLELDAPADAAVADADAGRLPARLPAGRRRGRRQNADAARSSTPPSAADLVADRRRGRTTRPTRTSGSTRTGSPTSATRSPTQLVEVDPDNAGTTAPTRRAQGRARPARRRLEKGCADCERDTVVVSHDAFGYLGERYGLTRGDRRDLPGRRALARAPRASCRT